MKRQRTESGQAAILLAMGMIALLAFTALAIDGGNMYLQKRNAQNAADAGAIAGTREVHRLLHLPLALANSNNLPYPIYLRGVINDFAQSNGVPDTQPDPSADPLNIVNDNIEAYYLDVDGLRMSTIEIGYEGSTIVPAGARGISITVDIPFDTFIAGLIGQPRAVATAKAGAVFEQTFASYFSAIYAGGYCTPTTLDLTGSYQHVVGGIHSNGTIKLSGNAANPSVYSGTVEYVGAISYHEDQIDFLPLGTEPEQVVTEDFDILFDISDYAYDPVTKVYGSRADAANLLGDYYFYPADTPGNVDVIPANGLHYTADPQGFRIPPSFPSDTPMKMTIVSPHEILFMADTVLSPYMDGILIFSTLGDRSCPSNQTAIQLSGSRFNWYGLVYAPNGHIDMSASENSGLEGLIVGWTVSLSGSQIKLIYDPIYDPPPPPKVVLVF